MPLMLEREVLYRGRILNLVRLEGRWEVSENAEAVAILAYRESDNAPQILGVRQRRPAIGQETWEVPAGLIDPGETPEVAAARELAEETQLTGTLQRVTQFYSSPGFTTEKIHLFEAADLRSAAATADPDEVLTVSWENPVTLWQHIREGQLASSGPTVIALMYLLARLGLSTQ